MSRGASRPPVAARGSSLNKKALGVDALRAAMKTRQQLQLPLNEAVCVYDAAEELGLEVRFDPIPSMEGMYVKQTLAGSCPHILISSLRPAGRQAMTAAHELGHHVFGHGTRIDQYVKGVGTVGMAIVQSGAIPEGAISTADQEEFLADSFGAFFLMPKSAVERGFAMRNLDPAAAEPLEIFRVAGWLGVGYGALVMHMAISLKLISWRRAEALLTAKPKNLREELFGRPVAAELYVVDEAWTGRPVDLKVGDVAILPPATTVEPTTGRFSQQARLAPGVLTISPNGSTAFEATTPGLGRFAGQDWAAFVRVSQREFAGRNIYRHLEATDDDDDNTSGT